MSLMVLLLLLQNVSAFRINLEKYFPVKYLPIFIEEGSYDMASSEDYVRFSDKDLKILGEELPFAIDVKPYKELPSGVYEDFIPVGRFRCYHNKWGVLIYHSLLWPEERHGFYKGFYIEMILLFTDLKGNVITEPRIVSCVNGISNTDTYCELFHSDISIGIRRKEIRYLEEYVSFPEK